MNRWIIYAIISMLFAGLTSVIAKFGMKDLSIDTSLAISTSVVFTIVIANAFILRNAFQELQQATAKNFISLAISGITTFFSWIFYYRTMKEGPLGVKEFIKTELEF